MTFLTISLDDNLDRAVDMIGFIHERLEMILEYPRIGRTRNELVVGLRSFVAGSYVTFYFPTEFGITVSRVLRSSRDVSDNF